MNNLENGQEPVTVEAESWAERHRALVRLHSNKDFQTLILQGYIHERAVDGVSMLANEYTIVNGKRGAIMEELVAVSHLQDYFRTVANLGAAGVYDEELDSTTNSVIM